MYLCLTVFKGEIIVTDGQTATLKSRSYGGESNLGAVVVLTEVAEEYVGECGDRRFGEEGRRSFVVHVASLGLYTRLQIFGISAVEEHTEVVVGF